MDFERHSQARRRKVRRIIIVAGALLGVVALTVGVSTLNPAVPRVQRAFVWIDAVKRGPMLRAVAGTGALVPVEIRWVPALTAGRVERILVLPGAAVKADTVVLELSNPELQQAALEAEWQVQAAEAELENLKVKLESERLNQQATTAGFKSDHCLAELEALADETLATNGLVPQLVSKRSRAKADELKNRWNIESKRLEMSSESARAQLTVQQSKVQQCRVQAQLKKQQVQSLKVVAGLNGILQKLGDREPLQAGQQLVAGANVARVADASRLKAEVKIPETQARDIELGQRAVIDTRNGFARGRVERIDPAVQNGTVTVDVALEGELPRGCRPDLTVEGTIELERLDNVLSVGRPVRGEPEAVTRLFKLVNGGRSATRVNVKLGRTSVNQIEVREGLEAGDQVIISDTSQWDGQDRIRLN
jgi:HlyD family secretion protein